MIDKPIGRIDAADLQRLVDNAVPEGRRLEYKASLPGNSDSEKKEFLADVSSFANAVGGDLIYGIADSDDGSRPTGVPASAPGLTSGDPDIVRLENMIRDGISPRIQGVGFQIVRGLPAGPALVMRIPQSWIGPHVVSFQQWSRFFSRNNGGKYPLDVFELRDAFTASASVVDRANAFILERVGRIVAGDVPMALDESRATILHAVPIASISRPSQVDLLKVANSPDLHAPIYSGGSYGHRFNLEGVASYAPTGSGTNDSYMQFFRNGAIESVTTKSFFQNRSGDILLGSRDLAHDIISFAERVPKIFQVLEMTAPVILSLALIGTTNVTLGTSMQIRFREMAVPFARDNLILPSLFVREFGAASAQVVKPILDTLWQAAGLPRCLDYADDGTWNPRP